MAWEDVPERMTYYEGLKYAPGTARSELMNYFGATDLDFESVPEHLRDEFEDALEYRIRACESAANATGKRWWNVL